MAALGRLQTRYAGFGLLMATTLLALMSFPCLPLSVPVTEQQFPDVNQEDGSCHQHVHLCWLRRVLTTVFNQTMSDDVHDMTNLYKFQTHIYLDNPEYHNTAVRPYPTAIEQARKVGISDFHRNLNPM